MPLTMVGVGESRPILRIGGSLIVQVKDARVAISRELAIKILV